MIVFHKVHAFLLSNIQFLRDLNVVMSNEVEKMIRYIYVLKLFLQKALVWIDFSLFLSRGKIIVFSNVKLA